MVNRGLLLYKIADCADMLFVRAQSVIRADGTPSAQARSLQIDVVSCVDRCRRSCHCAFSGVNHVFDTDLQV
jgi:predicted metal-binding protein